MSINSRLILIISLFVLIPMVSIGIVGHYVIKANVHDIRLSQLEAIADLKKHKISSFFDALKEDMKIIKNYYNIRLNLPIISNLSNDKKNSDYIKSKKMLREQLATITDSKPDIIDLMLVNLEGKIIYSNNPGHEDGDLGFPLPDPGNLAFKRGQREVFLSGVFRNERYNNRFGMIISAPVRDLDNELVGVVALEVDMAGIYQFIQDATGLGITGETLIGKKEGDKAVFLNPLRHDSGAAMKRTASFGKKDAFPMVESVQGREGSGISIDYRGVPIIAVWRHIPQLNWGLVAKLDLSEAYAPITQIRNSTLFFTMLVVVIAVLITPIVSHSISHPLNSLAKDAENIGLGNFNIKVDAIGGREFETLAKSISSMAENLKARENDLIHEKRFAQAVLENIEDGIVACDENAILSFFNRAMRNIHGIEEKSLSPEKWAEHYGMYRADGKTLMRKEDIPLFRAFNGEFVRDEEMMISPKSGKARFLMASGNAIYDNNGHKIGAVVSMHDVTDQKRANEELRKHQEGLEQIVFERTKELEAEVEERKLIEEALVRAKEDADMANKAKSDFLANMSHDIRTPMNAIVGMADLLNETKLSKDQKMYIEILSRAGQGLLCLINNTLDMAKIEAGELEISSATFDLADSIKDVVDTLCFSANKKGIHLESKIGPGVPSFVKGDKVRVLQVLFNLAGNAVKFTDKGSVTIEVEYIGDEELKAKGKYALRFSVRDTGTGIPEDMRKSIFEPYKQVEPSSSKSLAGTGLGTAISKELVSLMGGEIFLESEEGKGSNFYFTLPFEITEEGERQDGEPVMLKEITSSFDNPVSILLAEDSADNQMLIDIFFKKLPIELDTADNGKEAYEMYKENKYDLVLMDMEMPVMNGYEATKKIREWEYEQGLKVTPIIALTAHALSDFEQKSLDAGCSLHVSKPIKKDKLLSTIYNVLSKAQNI